MLYNPHMPSRERSVRVEAVVLRHSDWGEADRLVGLFTRQLGKIRAIAKGVRKMHSRKAGHLEPFTRTSLLLARGRDMFIITQAETIQAHTRLREDLLLVGYASYVIELLDRFTYEEGENRAMYRLLVDTLGRLSTEADHPPGCPLLRNPPAGPAGVPPAALHLRALWKRDHPRGPVFLRPGRGRIMS